MELPEKGRHIVEITTCLSDHYRIELPERSPIFLSLRERSWIECSHEAHLNSAAELYREGVRSSIGAWKDAVADPAFELEQTVLLCLLGVWMAWVRAALSQQ